MSVRRTTHDARRGVVYLVGGGPGDPALITVRGRELLMSADVVVHDRLVPGRLLDLAPPDAERVDVGKRPGRHSATQDEINAMLMEFARRGRLVVRLKGGDPFVFGRGFEEVAACRAAGVPCVVVPGVTSAVAAPASAGIPVTHRGVAGSFAVVTAARASETVDDWSAFAAIDTLVIMMGRAGLRAAAEALVAAGRSSETPAACIECGTTARQRVVTGTLGDIAERADAAELQNPMVTIVGEVAGFAESAALNAVAGDAAPLAGRRVVVTRPRSSAEALRRLLVDAGARVVECPVSRIAYCDATAVDAERLREVGRYDWIVFTSMHGVRGFSRHLSAIGLDARALAGARIAAVGPATARRLERMGLRADLVPGEHSAAGLVAAMGDEAAGRVLLPCGDLARDELSKGLSERGWRVDSMVVYRNEPVVPSARVRAALDGGFEVVVFCSPSAVRRYVEMRLPSRGAVVACIGPTMAEAARAVGLEPQVVARRYTNEGLVAALIEHARAAAVGCGRDVRTPLENEHARAREVTE